MFKKLRFLTKQRGAIVLLALASALVPFTSALAATTADVAVTATPTYISVTNSEASWAIGVVAESSTYWWTADSNAPNPEPFEAADMKSTITNTGSVAEDINIKIQSDWAGGVNWTSASSVGVNQVIVGVGITGVANKAAMTKLTTSDQLLADALAASGTVKWSAYLDTGTFTDGVQKSTTWRLTAVAN